MCTMSPGFVAFRRQRAPRVIPPVLKYKNDKATMFPEEDAPTTVLEADVPTMFLEDDAPTMSLENDVQKPYGSCQC